VRTLAAEEHDKIRARIEPEAPSAGTAAATQKSAHGPCFANRGANPRKGWREASNSSIASDETNQIIDEPSR
jgi:hypothetical protein